MVVNVFKLDVENFIALITMCPDFQDPGTALLTELQLLVELHEIILEVHVSKTKWELLGHNETDINARSSPDCTPRCCLETQVMMGTVRWLQCLPGVLGNQ